MKWSMSGRQDVYLEIAERYRQYIQLGLLGQGERLPSVRAAALELGVNPNTVARAYAYLEEQGYVRSLPKKGIYVCFEEVPQEDPHGRELVVALYERGVKKETLLKWIEEVYQNHD
ncbi:MAG: GntR family transcriptional regulator [Ruminococcaceae bacterium]|nr:GntR family transcriptional regulator [Oscillospiraceae bacterium]